MGLYATLILALGMSMDAFAAALGKGAVLCRPGLRQAVRIGLIFGVIETITPLIGWTIGFFASQFIMAWDHWIAFLLLCLLGIRMIVEGLRKPAGESVSSYSGQHGWMLLVVTAFATSIDAMAIGVSLALLNVNIIFTALAIGAATTLMATLGVMLGRVIRPFLGRGAEILGGCVLIAIGCMILAEHMQWFSTP